MAGARLIGSGPGAISSRRFLPSIELGDDEGHLVFLADVVGGNWGSFGPARSAGLFEQAIPAAR